MGGMYCLSCRYGLAGLSGGPCPECGRPFIATDPKTWSPHRHRSLFQGLIGLGFSILLFAVMIGLFSLLFNLNYGTDHFSAFYTLGLGGGVGLALVAAILAAVNRSWWGRVPILLVGILAVWVGLFLGSEKYFRVWQAAPNPPDEAFADTGPMGALFAGWIPGFFVVILLFLPCWLVIGLIRKRSDHRGESDHSGAPKPIKPSIPPTSYPTASPGKDRGV